jgi:hypothetical protein
MGAVRPHIGFVVPTQIRLARAMAVNKYSKYFQLFREFRGRVLFVRGMVHFF